MKKKLISLAAALLVFTTVSAQVSLEIEPLSAKADFIRNHEVLSVRLDSPDLEALEIEDELAEQQGLPPRYAAHLPVNISTENGGDWMELKGGARIWRLRLETPDALATTLLYSAFSIPDGGLVHIYNDDRSTMIGAFTSQNNRDGGNYASQIVFGNACTIEYYEPANVRGQGLIEIENLGYCYRMVYPPTAYDQRGGSDPCQVDINCSPEGNNWQDEKRGVVGLGLVFPGGSSWCTGSMVNNTAQNCAPYLLTALHCTEGSSSSNFGQYTIYYNYESTGCGSGNVNTSQSVVGCTELANSGDGGGNSGSDFSLLEVTSSIPSSYNVYYNGWNAQNSASGSGVGIHHPAGDRKKISTYSSSLSNATWGGTPGTHWSVDWVGTTNGHGVTEGGSSGSPLFDNQGRIVGTLTGGGSYCFQVPNTAEDQYGKVSYHWQSNPGDDLKDFLDPVNTGQLTLSGTYAPCTPPATDDAGISAINSPQGSICDNTITPVVVITNYGGNTLNSAIINYNVDGTGTQQFQWSGSLATNQSATVTLPAMIVSAGNHTFNAFTSNPNGQQTDSNTANDAAASAFSITIADTYVTLVLNMDDYGSETTWQLAENGGGVIASGGPYEDFENIQVVEDLCVASGSCYTFTIFDSFSDGICCYTGTQNPNYQDGSYSLGNANGVSLWTGSEFTSQESVSFCAPASAGTCDTLWDPFESNASGFALYPNNGGGYISGSNSFGDLAKAQAFNALQQPAEITGVIYWAAAKVDEGASVTANLYNLNGAGTDLGGATNSAPGTVLASGTQTLQRVDTAGFFNFIEFTNPVTVSNAFAVGLDFSGFGNNDAIGIVTNADGDANGADQAWEQWSNGDWHSMNEAWNSQTNGDFDLAIFPIVCPQNVTGIDDLELQFSLFPNPTNGNLALVNSEKVTGTISIFNMLGEVVHTQPISGQTVVNLSLEGHTQGIYLVQVDAGAARWTERVVLR